MKILSQNNEITNSYIWLARLIGKWKISRILGDEGIADSFAIF